MNRCTIPEEKFEVYFYVMKLREWLPVYGCPRDAKSIIREITNYKGVEEHFKHIDEMFRILLINKHINELHHDESVLKFFCFIEKLKLLIESAFLISRNINFNLE